MQTNFFLLALLWCFFGATFWQLFFCWSVFARFAFYSNQKNRLQERQNNTLLTPFSVIICARNEANNLRRYLPGILAQEYDSDWELLVVDDASADDTQAVLQAFQSEYPRLNVLRLTEKPFPGKKYALEKGIEASKYAHILLTDADCQPAGPHWLLHMAETLNQSSETEIALGFGPMKAAQGTLNRWARFETAHTAMQYFSFALAGVPYMGVGRNLAIKKSLFERVGGFTMHREIPSGDDDLLVNAAATPGNTAICTDPAAFVFSEPKTTWRQWLLQKRRHLGASSAYRPIHQFLLASWSLSHVLHYFLMFLLLCSGWCIVVLVLAYCLRMLTLLIIYRGVFSRLRCSDLLLWIPLLDVLLAIYYGIFVPWYLIFRPKIYNMEIVFLPQRHVVLS